MEILNLTVILRDDETPLAMDILSGRIKTLVLPYYFPHAEVEKFALIVTGDRPGVALISVKEIYHDHLGDLLINFKSMHDIAPYKEMILREADEDHNTERIFTIIEIGEIEMLSMDFKENLNARYLRGELREEEETEIYGC